MNRIMLFGAGMKRLRLRNEVQNKPFAIFFKHGETLCIELVSVMNISKSLNVKSQIRSVYESGTIIKLSEAIVCTNSLFLCLHQMALKGATLPFTSTQHSYLLIWCKRASLMLKPVICLIWSVMLFRTSSEMKLSFGWREWNDDHSV